MVQWLEIGFPGGSVVKNLPANAEGLGLIPGLGRSPGEGNANPLRYSCLGNPMDRGDWQATVHGVSDAGRDWGPEEKGTTADEMAGWHH